MLVVYIVDYTYKYLVYTPSVVNLSLESVNDRAHAIDPLLNRPIVCCYCCCLFLNVVTWPACVYARILLLPFCFSTTSIFSYSFIVIIWLLAIIIQSNNQMHFIYESQTKREDNNYLIVLNMLLQHFSISFEFFNVNAELAECVSLNVLSVCRSWKKWNEKIKIKWR